MLPKLSSAVTVKVVGVPAVAVAGSPDRTNCVVAAALTVIALLVWLRAALLVSVAVTVRWPAVLRVTVNVPTPPISVLLAGSKAAGSLLVIATVPV